MPKLVHYLPEVKKKGKKGGNFLTPLFEIIVGL